MILIISDERDTSTNHVIDWLIHFRQPYYRINITDKIRIEELTLDNFGMLDYKIIINNKDSVYFSEIHSYWYRRGSFIMGYKIPTFSSKDLTVVSNRLNTENDAMVHFLHCSLKQFKKGIGFFYDNEINKLLCLKVAKECGLDIPNTFLCDNKIALRKFIKENGEYITKSNDVPFAFSTQDCTYTVTTSKFSYSDIAQISDSFFPTVFQTQIKKNYEIRTFYINEKCFSMAIFSQNDEQTKFDFRNYNWEKPNRTVPYKLPDEVENKIIQFMYQLNLNCGSLDFIFNVDGKYIFLEVNVVGQFSQVSFPCNYQLEKLIAEELIYLGKN